MTTDLRFVTLSAAGWYHACGVTVQNKLYCWGGNGMGQLGDGTTSSSTSPVQVGSTWSDVETAGQHRCAIAIGGDAYCWGWNDADQLGRRATHTCEGGELCALFPGRVMGSQVYASLGMARYHSCDITTGGRLYCWGAGPGRRPDGVARSVVPFEVASGMTAPFDDFDGGYSASCTTLVNGGGFCWCSNSFGSLGAGLPMNDVIYKTVVRVRDP